MPGTGSSLGEEETAREMETEACDAAEPLHDLLRAVEEAAAETGASGLSALIEARGDASQEEVAKRMRTSQPNVARLEGGRANPSLSTLRRYAAATGTRLKIVFERKRAR